MQVKSSWMPFVQPTDHQRLHTLSLALKASIPNTLHTQAQSKYKNPTLIPPKNTQPLPSTSKSMKYGEVTHFSHPHHKLRFEYSEFPFKCDGCKEVGIGSRFKCSLCDYDLHRHCALPLPSSVLRHAFYRKCEFHFLPLPPGSSPRFCNACERDVCGFVYHCKTCGFDLHPCCAALPHVIDTECGMKLYLYRKVSAPCHRCGRKGRSWSYRSACKKYNLHVACVTEMLVESWHEIYFGYGSGGGKRAVQATKVPIIRGAGRNHHRGKGKVKRCCEMAAIAIQFIISAVLGDPTAMIAGVIGSFLPR